jgi:hypothetical protein
VLPGTQEYQLLQSIAVATGGQVFQLDQNGRIADVLHQIFKSVTRGVGDATYSAVFVPGSPSSDYSLILAVTDDEQPAASGITAYLMRPGTGSTDPRVFVHAWGPGWLPNDSATLWTTYTVGTPVQLEITLQTTGEAPILGALLNNIPLQPVSSETMQFTPSYLRIAGMHLGGAASGTLIRFDNGSHAAISLAGSLVEVGCYPGILDPAQRLAIRQSLARKYGLRSLVNIPPVAVAGGPYVVTDQGWNGHEPVALNGSASVDPDGVIAEPNGYEWLEGGVLIARPSPPLRRSSPWEFTL